MVAMKNYENSKLKLEEDLKQAMCNSKNVDSKQSDKLNDKVKLLEKDLAQEQRNLVVEKSKHEELERTLSKAKENVSRLAEDKKQLVADAEKAKEQCEKLIKDRMQYEEEITKLKEDLSTNRLIVIIEEPTIVFFQRKPCQNKRSLYPTNRSRTALESIWIKETQSSVY